MGYNLKWVPEKSPGEASMSMVTSNPPFLHGVASYLLTAR
jgi:hypothetical protein